MITFSVGFYSLIYNDGFNISELDSKTFDVISNDSVIKFGKNNMQIKDGDSYVNIGLDGIEVIDGDEHVKIGLDGININDGKGSKLNIGTIKSWFGLYPSNLKTISVEEEKTVDIEEIKEIKINSIFTDVKLIKENREDVKILYHGTMKSNVLPTLEINKLNGELEIKLLTKSNKYSVVNSDVILEIWIPKDFNQDITVDTSSGDIYVLDISGRRLNLSSSSGDISLNKSIVDYFVVNSSSGDISINDISGYLNVFSSSGDVVLDVSNHMDNIDISTSSGDVDIFLGSDANFSVSGSTASGEVSSNGPISVNQDKNNRFDFVVGDGDKTLKITTSSGDISFKR